MSTTPLDTVPTKVPTSFPPEGFTEADLWLERSNFDGAVLGGVAYGVHLAVFSVCVYYLLGRSGPRGPMKNNLYLFAFIFSLFTLGTLNLACNTKIMEDSFINNRAFPEGGPMGWFFANYGNSVNTTGNVAYIIGTFITDGLLLWRTYVVWNNWMVIIFPILMYMGSTAMSILLIFQVTRPDASFWTTTSVQFAVPYFSLSIALNTLLTILIVSRLMYMSNRLGRSVGQSHARTYTSIASMLIESAAPYTIFGLIFIITYARESNVQNLVLPVLSQVMCINPELIMLRVLMGRDMNTTTMGSSARAPVPHSSGYSGSSQPTMEFARRHNYKGSEFDTSIGGGTAMSSFGDNKTLQGDESRYNITTLKMHGSAV